MSASLTRVLRLALALLVPGAASAADADTGPLIYVRVAFGGADAGAAAASQLAGEPVPGARGVLVGALDPPPSPPPAPTHGFFDYGRWVAIGLGVAGGAALVIGKIADDATGGGSAVAPAATPATDPGGDEHRHKGKGKR